MRFQFDITLTEADYWAFNHFHALESAIGKKQINKARICFTAIMAALIVLVSLILGVEPISIVYAVALSIFTLLYVLLFKKIVKHNIKMQIKQLKKTGKLPFDPEVKLEFHEDKWVEIAPGKRTEQSYCALERICITKDRYIFLYISSVSACILPIPQLREQINLQDFLDFISPKCNTVEYY